MTGIEPVAIIPKRKSLTKAQRVRVFDQAGGRCHLCQQPIKHGEKWEAEHPAFRAGGGSDKIADLRPAHIDCHKPKSAEDVRTLAKTNRVRAAHLGVKTAPARPIRSAPFPTSERAAARRARGPRESLPIRMPRGFVSASDY